MTSDRAARDRANNQKFQDIYVHAAQEPWLPFFSGIDFKVLRATQETGHWTILLKCAKGASIPRHEHLGQADPGRANLPLIQARVDHISGPDSPQHRGK